MMEQPALDSPSASWRRWTVGCIVLGALLRLGLSLISFGTNDAGTWLEIAQFTRAVGIIQAYTATTENNHPLIPVYWSQLANALGGERWFYFIFKLAPIAADLGSVWIAARMAARLSAARAARLAAVAVALSPIGILISGYHCNTDSCYAFFCLLSADLLMQNRFGAAGLALGAGINVKLIPVILVPLAFSLCRNWRQAGRLFAALALWVLPFTPMLAMPDIFRRNMLQYTSVQDNWGIYTVFYGLLDASNTHELGIRAGQIYLSLGRVIIIGLILILTVASFFTRRWSAVQLYFAGICIFFTFTPGFGLQYLTLPVGFLAVLNRTKGWQFGVTAALFATITYLVYLWWDAFPLQTVYTGHLPLSAAVFGVLAWGILIQVGAITIFQPRRQAELLTPLLAATEANR